MTLPTAATLAMNRLATLDAVQIIFLLVLPLLLLVAGFVLYFLERSRTKKIEAELALVEDGIADFPYLSMENRAALEEVIAQNPDGTVERALEALLIEADAKYSGRWLPPLEQELTVDRVRGDVGTTAFLPAAILAVVGVIGSLALGLTGFNEHLMWLPALAGLVAAAMVHYGEKSALANLGIRLEAFYQRLARVFPVFNDRSGSALLIEDLLSHESKVEAAIRDFNETARYLAESEFSKGIQASVKQIMREEISPPITESAKLMQDLSGRLIDEQQQGMQRLANEFSQSLARTISDELNPLSGELTQLNQLMHDTREFIHDSVAVLETSRQQNITLNRDLSESLKLMTVAKNDLANEMSEISSNLEVISRTTEKMAALYAGEEARLSERIHTLSTAMDHALETISDSISSSAKSLELASSIRSDQETQNNELIERLTQMTNEMGEISRSLLRSSQNFTKESSSYVNQTLKNFDAGLAEVVERLIFTASAIRDAVDALPVALRPNQDN